MIDHCRLLCCQIAQNKKDGKSNKFGDNVNFFVLIFRSKTGRTFSGAVIREYLTGGRHGRFTNTNTKFLKGLVKL